MTPAARWTLGIASGLLALSLGSPVECQSLTRTFEVPGHGALGLAVPAGWRAEVRPLQEPASVTLHVRPETGASFDVQLTAIWLDAKKLKKTTSESIRDNMQKAAKELLAQAVEKAATLKELPGAQTIGWYYALTDRSPAPGEFKYLTQGSFLTGELLCAFTVLHHTPDAGEVLQALRVFGDAVHAR
jgi:hypothetical protein